MPGRRKERYSREDYFPEEGEGSNFPADEYGYQQENSGTKKYQPIFRENMTDQDMNEEYPDEYYDDAGETQDGYYGGYEENYDEENPEQYTDEPMEEEEESHPHSIFRPRTGKPNFILSVAVNVIRVMCVLVLAAGFGLVGVVAGIAKGYVETAPTLDTAELGNQDQTSFIYDCNGNLITEYKGTENRVMVSIQAMPKMLQQAFVAVEDGRFYTHNGVDVKRIVGAFVANMTSSSTQGGSTITQQLIKNTVLTNEVSYKRKIQEAYLAMELEQQYSKDEILECYLNTIFLGENYYGVQVAAMGYFGKSLGELTLRECAMLAGTNNSPYYYNPRRNFYQRQKEGVDYPKITNDRTDYVLRCMYEGQFITYQQYQEALDPSTAHVLEKDPSVTSGIYQYPHYVEYAVKEVVNILLEINGLENTSANRAAMETEFRTGGYRVKLAVDPEIQSTVEETIENWNKYPSLRDPADKTYRVKNSDGTYTEIIQPQCAAVVLDYRTGEIKAIVGGRTHPTVKKSLNRATDMKMPVGSSIKPIAVYGPALDLGASPASIAYNMALPISGWKNSKGQDAWPQNYGGGKYAGPETLRQAMAASHNTAAAYTLLNMVGVNRSVDYLHRMGIDDDHIDSTPFGLSLGSSGITPLQMTVAYGVLANDGVYQEPISVLGISDSTGKVIWDGHANQERRRVFRESTSYMIVDMLKSVVSSGTAGSAKIKGQTVGGKTGTNSDQKGVFFAGVTGYYASSVWVGHDNYKALASKSTGSGAAIPVWQSYMSKIHQGLPNRDILEGDPSQYGLVKATTCVVSGQLATDACRNDALGYGTVTDYWADGTVPTVYCQMHQTAQICTDSGMLASPFCPNIAEQGVVVIPQGHPLYRFIGTEYEDVLREKLGDSSVSSWQTCTWHTQYSESSGANSNPVVDNSLMPDARTLLSQAESMLQTLDPSSDRYFILSDAIINMQNVMASSPSITELAGAMSILSGAMN